MTEESTGKCPNSETLSAYYDALCMECADGDETKAIQEHLASCAACRKKLDDYALIDRALNDALTPDTELAERVKAKCRAAELQRRWRSFGRVAAVAAVVIGVAAGLWLSERQTNGGGQIASRGNDETNTTAVARVEPKNAGQTVVQPLSPMEDVAFSDDWLDWHEPTVSSQPPAPSDLSNGAIRPAGMNASQRMAVAGQGSVNEISDSVRHIWIVDDLAASRELLMKYMKRSGVKAAVSDKDGRLIVQFRGLKDRQLQGLVEQLHARHWALVSPMLPQPKQWDRVKFTGKPVTYTVWAVEKAKQP